MFVNENENKTWKGMHTFAAHKKALADFNFEGKRESE